ncbi:MAG: MarC family protein [Pseudomonadota bacterium]
MSAWGEYVHFLVALVAIVDIPGNVPMFLQRTANMTNRQRGVVALTAAAATALILAIFAMFGPSILNAFGITIEAFKILGGFVILLMALEMLGLMHSPSADDVGTQTNPVAIGIFPMAVPLFAGPGAISAVMVFAHFDRATPAFIGETLLLHDLIVLVVVGSIAVMILVGLMAAGALSRFLTPLVQDILNRLLGIIVGALGVEFILEGLQNFFSLAT